MAERSFAREVQQLRVGCRRGVPRRGHPGDHQGAAGKRVGYVADYQGAPISHLMDVLADASDILGELGVHFESSANEAAAAATLATSVMYPIRGAVTFKSTAGTNVASDALSNLSSSGVTRGRADHPGGGLRRGLLDHAGAQPRLRDEVAVVADGPAAEFCRRSSGWWNRGSRCRRRPAPPVMLEVRIRACHVHGSFVARDNRTPAFSLTRRVMRRAGTPAGSCCRRRVSRTSKTRSPAVAGGDDYIQAHG